MANPTLKSIRYVEEKLKEHQDKYTKTGLWQKVIAPRMEYSAYKLIVDYLIESNKVSIVQSKLRWTA